MMDIATCLLFLHPLPPLGLPQERCPSPSWPQGKKDSDKDERLLASQPGSQTSLRVQLWGCFTFLPPSLPRLCPREAVLKYPEQKSLISSKALRSSGLSPSWTFSPSLLFFFDSKYHRPLPSTPILDVSHF